MLSISCLCGLPLQALWAQFKPDAAVVDPDSWTMSKMGSPISPLNVVLNGSQSMHAVDDEGIVVEGMGLQRSWEQLQIRQVSPNYALSHSTQTEGLAARAECIACILSESFCSLRRHP